MQVREGGLPQLLKILTPRAAYGGAAVLASLLDIRIGCEATKFRFLAAAYGRINSTWTLPNQVGWPIAKELLFSARIAEGALYSGGANGFLINAATYSPSNRKVTIDYSVTRDGTPIGTGRLKPDCSIGRMAVVKEWRGRGVGAAILDTLLAYAEKEGCGLVRLHAQTHALQFYARRGFKAIGGEFEEAGIPHRVMELRFPPAPADFE